MGGSYLEDSQHSDGERVKVGGRGPVLEVESSAEELHAKQCKDQDEEEQEEQQRDDRFHRRQEGHDQVTQ